MLLSCGRGPLAHEGFVTCFRGEESGEGHYDLSASAVFSNFFTLKYAVCQGARFWGVVCPDPVTSPGRHLP